MPVRSTVATPIPTARCFPREEQNSFFGQFHQKIMDGVEFSTKFLWSTRLDSAMDARVERHKVAIDNTNPYFQSINGETTPEFNFAFGPYPGSQSLPITTTFRCSRSRPS